MNRKHDPSVARSFKYSNNPHLKEQPIYNISTSFLISPTTLPSEEFSGFNQHPISERFKSERPAWLHLSFENSSEESRVIGRKREGSLLPYLNTQRQIELPSETHPQAFSPFHPPTIPLPPTPLSPSTPTEPYDFKSVISPSSQSIENLDFLKRSLPGPSPSAPLPPIPVSPVGTATRPKSYTFSKPFTLFYDHTDPSHSSDNADLSTALPPRRPSSTASLVSSTFRLSTFSIQSSATSLPSSDGFMSSPVSTCSSSRKRMSRGSIVTGLWRCSEQAEGAVDQESRVASPINSNYDSCDEEKNHKLNESGSDVESDIDLNTSLSTFAMRSRIISPNSRLLIKKMRSSQSKESTSDFVRRPSLPSLQRRPSIQIHRFSSVSASAAILSYEDGWMASDSEEEVLPVSNSPLRVWNSDKRNSLTLNGSGPAVQKRLSAMDLILSFPSPPTEPSVSLPASEVSVPTFVQHENSTDSTSLISVDENRQAPLSASLSSEITLPNDASETVIGHLLSDEPELDEFLSADLTLGSPTMRSTVPRSGSLSPAGDRFMPVFGGQVLPLPRRMSDEDESVWGEVEVAFHTPQPSTQIVDSMQLSLPEGNTWQKDEEVPYSKPKEVTEKAVSSVTMTAPSQQSNMDSLGKGHLQGTRLNRMRSDASLNPPGRKIPTPSIRRVASNALLKTPARPVDTSSLPSLPIKQNTGATTSGATSISSVPKHPPRSNTVLGRSPGLSTPSKALLPSTKLLVPNFTSRIPTTGKATSTTRLPRRMNPKSDSPPSSFKWISP